MMRSILSLAFAGLFAFPLFAQEQNTPDPNKPDQQVDLRYRSYRNWSIRLPSEKWFPIKDAIRIGESAGPESAGPESDGPESNGAVFAVQLDGNDLRFDTDADGELDRTIKPLVDAKTNVSTTRVILTGKEASGKTYRYAVRLRRDAAGWEWAPGSALAGTINTEAGPVPIRIIDQNGNGRFDDFGSDAVVVGTTEFATLLSKTIAVDGQLWNLDVSKDQASIQLSDFDGPTAEIDLKSSFESKAVLLSAVIVSDDGQHSFDVGMIDGAVKVPAGTYSIESGTLGLGDQRVQVLKGRMKPIQLAATSKHTLQWGGPIQSEFQFARSGDQIQFSPNQVSYFGKAGERYVGWTPIGKSPEFKVLNADTGAVLEVAILPGSC